MAKDEENEYNYELAKIAPQIWQTAAVMLHVQAYISDRSISYWTLAIALESLDSLEQVEAPLDLTAVTHFKLALISLARDEKRERQDKNKRPSKA